MQTIQSVLADSYYPLRLTITSSKTIHQYQIAARFFDRYLGRAATLDDLTDDTISRFTRWMHVDLKLSPATANERSGRLITLWNWLAKRRIVESFPSVSRLRVPRRTPKAWTIEEIARLYDACERTRGAIAGNHAPDWWRALFGLLWNTGERITALLSVEWPDLQGNTLTVRAECRKANRSDETYTLWPEVVAAMQKLSKVNRRILEHPSSESALYHRMAKLLQWAGLPGGRQHKFHCFRVSHATWVQVSGGNASHALRHASPAVTQRHYIDPRVAKIPPADLPRGFLKK